MNRLAGKAALVTGGGSGIGQGIAEVFAAEGASVAVLDIEAEWAEETEVQLKAKGAQALGIHGDVAKSNDIQEAVGRCLQEWDRLDILVNNAATSKRSSADLNLAEVPEAEWDRMMAVNLKGPLFGIQAVAPIMKAAGGGGCHQYQLDLGPFMLSRERWVWYQQGCSGKPHTSGRCGTGCLEHSRKLH